MRDLVRSSARRAELPLSCIPACAYDAPVSDDVELEQQIRAIRLKISSDGGCDLRSEQMPVFCPEHLSIPEQFARVAAIARRERWSFAFLPDGRIRFAALEG